MGVDRMLNDEGRGSRGVLRRGPGVLIAVVGIIVMTLGLASASSGTRAKVTITAPPAWTAQQVMTPAGNDWIDFGGDIYNQRYSTLKDINLGNANTLKQAWQTHLPEPPGTRFAAGGLEYGGVYYIIAGTDDVYALDATTGDQLWKWSPPTPQTSSVRGLAMGAGKIYVAEYDNYIVALDAKTGAQVWKSDVVGDPTAGEYMNNPLLYYPLSSTDGEIVSGTGGSDAGLRGFIQAWDANTGKTLWKTYMIPLKPGDPGYSTWGQPADLEHGGGGDWGHAIADPALGLIYVATANAQPYANRPKGDDLYTASEVALNAKTGKMVWYYQMVHHDTWDYDISANNPVLYDYTKNNGRLVHAIDQPTKSGMNFILNRVTGKPLIPTPELPQPQDPEAPNNAKTQPIPTGQPFGNPCSTPQEWIKAGGDPSLLGPDGKPLVFGCNYTPVVPSHYTVPGWHDTADWPPNTFSRTTGLMYVCSTNDRGDAYEAVPVADAVKGPGNRGYGTMNVSEVGGDWVANKTGVVTAINPRNNDIAWKAILPDGNGCYSGLTSTAGKLVFVSTFDGHVLAYDAGNGKIVWESPQLEASGGAPPIIYKGSDGREYVTLLVAGQSNSRLSKPGNSVYSFALPK